MTVTPEFPPILYGFDFVQGVGNSPLVRNQNRKKHGVSIVLFIDSIGFPIFNKANEL